VGLLDSFSAVFTRLAFRFEFFFPQFIGFYIKRKLKEYKQNQLIDDYKVKSRRKGKYHYYFDVDLFFEKQKNGGETLWQKTKKDT